MMKKRIPILLVSLLLCLPGCFTDALSGLGGKDIVLTIRCSDTPLTKADPSGEDQYNENLIRSVDFLFYPGSTPDPDENAVYRIREEMPGETRVHRQKTFELVVKKNVIEQFFDEQHKATVYVLVNADASFINENLSGSSLNELARKVVETDFAAAETNYLQPSFLMDGRAKLTYNEQGDPSVTGTVEVTRFAAKLSVSARVVSSVTLHHEGKYNDEHEYVTEPDELWTPVLHTMRIYLVDGVKTIKLSHDESTLPDDEAMDDNPEYFSYHDVMRSFVQNDNLTPVVGMTTEGGMDYYDSYPMYTYPRSWDYDIWDYNQMSFQEDLPPEQPYLKLEIDWRREEQNGYSYDMRKYYYKIFLPFEDTRFLRNHWYHFFLNVGILGSETDEGKVLLEPSCYILDWQNKNLIDKYAVISSARYLSVDRTWEMNNVETLSIPFLSSHNVKIVNGTVKARRPYYGEITNLNPVNSYSKTLHAWIREDEEGYYLDYTNQSGSEDGDPDFEPANWFSNTSTSIHLEHHLINDYELRSDFDYSPYTIELDIVHDDLNDPETITYQQIKKHITITQYPGIYIEAELNSDSGIKANPGNTANPFGYQEGNSPWLDQPWGYVYVNGRDRAYHAGDTYTRYTRLVRWDRRDNNVSIDPFFKLTTTNNKREYQWQTVWYTGGSRDLFKINVTVLQKNSSFVIGDPRTDELDNMDSEEDYPNLYKYVNDGTGAGDAVLPSSRTGFTSAKALYGTTPRSLSWYYPTEESTRTENMLAPSYRIASKFGGTEYGGKFFGDITKEYAKYRCAGYQEDGYPAGRWRLPTKAEIHFIAQLSARKVFEPLFTSGSPYWSAHGVVVVNNDSGTVNNSDSKTALLRCVYDSWYWDPLDDRQTNRSIFVWGDKER